MTEIAVDPEPTDEPAGVPLPFDHLGAVELQGGDVLGQVACAVWPASRVAETATGEQYDHEGEADVAGAPLLVRQPNRQLRVDGVLHKVIEAHCHDFIPHISLRLREVRGA